MKRLVHRYMARQSVMWANMSIRQQMEWSDRARDRASERMNEMEELWRELQGELDTLEQTVDVRKREGLPLSMSSAAMSERDLACFAHLWGCKAFGD